MNNSECPVCLEEFEKEGLWERFVLRGCGHSLCRDCCQRMENPTESSVVCPLCRTSSHTSTTNLTNNAHHIMSSDCANGIESVVHSCHVFPSDSSMLIEDLEVVHERLQIFILLKRLAEFEDITHFHHILQQSSPKKPFQMLPSNRKQFHPTRVVQKDGSMFLAWS